MNSRSTTPVFLPHEQFGQLTSCLVDRGYRCLGPKLEDGVVVFREYENGEVPARGMQAVQTPGNYKPTQDANNRFFGWATGPQALKPMLFAPVEPLWRSEQTSDQLGFVELVPQTGPLAVIGVRACDLAALAIQDTHFLHGEYPNAHYARRREGLFLVAVQCAEPAATCFCASTGDGPTPDQGFDISLTELETGFIATAGSAQGEILLASLNLVAASETLLAEIQIQEQAAIQIQKRNFPSRNLRQALLDRLEHPRWEVVAARCLSCGNCTAVCPTCFCHSHEIKSGMEASHAEQVRNWDSCFGETHGYLHGFQIRPDTRARYRQWLVHKLGTWHEQFGRSGCVGCGRCITWCPAGIDLTEEVAALMEPA